LIFIKKRDTSIELHFTDESNSYLHANLTMNTLSSTDYIVFLIYFIMVASYGFWIYRRKKEAADTNDYFLAEGSLTWWAIGASLIASNISAEQFIGMSGSGFKMGLAIASYEWMAAATLIIVAIFFMPVYLKNRIFTMPQFLAQRYNEKVALVMAIFWLMLYIVVNLTSILYLGALALNSLTGIHHTFAMIALGSFAVIITLGGMRVIGFTDILQVFFLILGGLATTYLALNLVADQTGQYGIWAGFLQVVDRAPGHFHMILQPDNSNYLDLPGLTVLVGGLWIANLNYWGCNQYITQRALGADLKTARNGLLFAAFLKLLMPVIVVLPGIAAFVLYHEGLFQTEMLMGGEINPDRAYPLLLNLLPTGLKGLAFAALTAAIVASLAGKSNSIATIFSLDIYKKYMAPNAGHPAQIWVGKITIVVSMIIAILLAPHLGIDKKGGFQMIQEYTGFLSPGIFAMFLLGLFWKRTNSAAALFATVGGFILSITLKFLPLIVNLHFLSGWGFAASNAEGVYEIPFLDRMMIVFVFCIMGMVILSYLIPQEQKKNETGMLRAEKSLFKVHPGFMAGSIIVLLILALLYGWFW
jgi:solute:Na+ symporter, SSS family